MNRRGLVGIVSLASLASCYYEAPFDSEVLSIELSPQSPGLALSGILDAGEDVWSMTFSLNFYGTNRDHTASRVSLAFDPAAGPRPRGALDAVDIIEASEERDVSFTLRTEVEDERFGPFDALLLLEGAADLSGDLYVDLGDDARADVDRWVRIVEVEARPLLAEDLP